MGRKAIDKQRNTNPVKRDLYQARLAAIFKKHGLKKYNMDIISKELGLSKATLYHYFSSKDEMVASILNDVLLKLRDVEPVLTDASQGFADRYYRGLQLISENISDISNHLLADLRDEYPRLWKEVQNFIDYLAELLRDFYEQGKKAGVFRNIHTSMLVLSDRLFFDAITNVEFFDQHGLTLQEAFDQYFNMKSEGFLKREGK
jgi:AcrR family transcriptional regulator